VTDLAAQAGQPTVIVPGFRCEAGHFARHGQNAALLEDTIRSTRGLLIVLVTLVVALGLSSCSSATPFGGSGLPAPTSGCGLVQGTPPVPLVLSHGNGGTTPFVPVCVDGHGPYWFVLDTGVAASFVDSQLVAAAHLPGTTANPTAVAVGCTSARRRVTLEHWSVGGIALAGQSVVTADIAGFGLSGSPAGVLGGDVLSRFGAIRVDYRAETMTVLAPEGRASTRATILRATALQPPPPLLVHATPRSAALLTVLKFDGDALASAATAFSGGGSHPFLVDSGSSVSTVAAGLARMSNLAATGQSIDAPGIGCSGAVDLFYSGQWSIGTVALPERPLAGVSSTGEAPNGLDGTLGSDVLASYGSVVLDYRTAILWLGAG